MADEPEVIVIEDSKCSLPNLPTNRFNSLRPSIARSSCIRCGIHDSTCTKLSIAQLSTVIEETLLKIKTNSISLTTSVQLLYTISERSVELLSNQTTHSIVTGILSAALELIQFHDISLDKLLCSQFLREATKLVVDGVKNDREGSYEFNLLLWQLHFPSYRNTLLEVLQVGILEGVASIKLINHIKEACDNIPHLKLFTVDFFQYAIELSNNSLIIQQLYSSFIK